MDKIDWEILDPKLDSIIEKLTNNISDLKKENKLLNKNIKELKKEISNTNNIIVEQTFLFNQIKTFLEENRKRYTKSFTELNKKINRNKELNENIKNDLDNKFKINKDITSKLNENDIKFNKSLKDSNELKKKISNE